jgi:hypothetical protein
LGRLESGYSIAPNFAQQLSGKVMPYETQTDEIKIIDSRADFPAAARVDLLLANCHPHCPELMSSPISRRALRSLA